MSRLAKRALGLLGYLNPMNLPRALFLRYRPTDKPYFGSRFMHFLGTTFMGTPKSKGLGDLRQDLQDTYYYLKVDRLIPNDEADQKEWRIHSIKAQIYRELEHMELAKAIWMTLSVAALVLVFGVSFLPSNFSWTSEDGPSASSPRKATESVVEATDEITVDAATCESLGVNYQSGRLTTYQRNNFEALAAACNELPQ